MAILIAESGGHTMSTSIEEKIAQKMQRFQAFGEGLPGAKVYYREDWDAIYFDLVGKQFGIMSPQPEETAFLTLKNLPEVNETLREQFPDVIIPGYYANKTHWNTIKLASDALMEENIEQMILVSYDLVKQKLTKKQKSELENSEVKDLATKNNQTSIEDHHNPFTIRYFRQHLCNIFKELS